MCECERECELVSECGFLDVLYLARKTSFSSSSSMKAPSPRAIASSYSCYSKGTVGSGWESSSRKRGYQQENDRLIDKFDGSESWPAHLGLLLLLDRSNNAATIHLGHKRVDLFEWGGG